jgi:HPt (histidine-containing phosphotransfer) domain-containing protein
MDSNNFTMSNSSQGTEKITNLEYLMELSKGDQYFISEMIRIFLEENPREIKMLEDGINGKDFQLINLAAHKLRSTLPFVGIEKLIEKEVVDIETLACNNAVQKIEVAPDEDHDIRKIEIITTNRSTLRKIEELFPKVKAVCEQARSELAAA